MPFTWRNFTCMWNFMWNKCEKHVNTMWKLPLFHTLFHMVFHMFASSSVNSISASKLTCDQALFFSRRCSQRKNERLIQLLVESSVKSPESGLFSDWSGNKRQFAQMFAHFVPASRLCWFPPTKRLPVNCDWLTLIWWHRWHSRWQTL